MKNTKIFAIIAIIVVAIIVIALFVSRTGVNNKSSAALKQVSLAEIPVSYSAITHLAGELGYYKEYGVDVVTASVPAGPDVMSSLRSPSGDTLGTIAITPVVSLIAAGEHPIILATIMGSNEQVQLITFSKNGITENPKTLKGKKIGRVRNTIGEIYLSRLIKKEGLEPSDIELVDGRPADLSNLLIKGEVDAAILWDPFIPQIKRNYAIQVAQKAVSDRGDPAVFIDKDIYTVAYNVVTTKEKMEGRGEEIKNFLRSALKAGEYIKQNPEDAQQRLEKWLNLEPGDLNHFMSTTDFLVHLDVPALETWLKEELDWLGTVQEVKNKPADLSPFIDYSLLSEIDSARVTK